MDMHGMRDVEVGQITPDFTWMATAARVFDMIRDSIYSIHNDAGTRRDQEKILDAVRWMAA